MLVDNTATAPANTNTQTSAPIITAGGHVVEYFRNGPAYFESLQVSMQITADSSSQYAIGTTTLNPWVDYYPAFYFDRGTVRNGKPLCGGIVLASKTIRGQINITYQSLIASGQTGGRYQKTDAEVQSLISALTSDPTAVGYDLLRDTSTDLSDILVYQNPLAAQDSEQLNASLAGLLSYMAAPVTYKTPMRYDLHVADIQNPHNVTTAQLGLDKVPNWGLATPAMVTSATGSPSFVTPELAALAVGSKANVPQATLTTDGTFKLNVGAIVADADDGLKALTAYGIVQLRNLYGSTFYTLFGSDTWEFAFNTAGQSNPIKFRFPCTMLGTVCKNFEDIRKLIVERTGIRGVQISKKRAAIWIPTGVISPNLTIT